MIRAAFRFAAGIPLTLAAVACGGGPQHIGDITPVVQERLSGAWVLNAEESDDPQEALAAARPPGGRGGGAGGGTRPGGGGRMPPGGGTASGGGGTPTGGRGGTSGAGGRGGMQGGADQRAGNPEAMRALMRIATVPPRHLDVSLSDSLVTVAYTTQDVWMLPFGQNVNRDLADHLKLQVKAAWENDRLVVRRSIKGSGFVTETYMPSMDGQKLTVAVETSVGGSGGVEFRRVYDVAPKR